MTALMPANDDRGLHLSRRGPVIELLLSNRDGSSGSLAGASMCGATLRLSPVDPVATIAPDALGGAQVAIVEVSVDDPQSLARFQQVAASAGIPVLAAVYEAPLALVRTLLRTGAHDVLPLPLDLKELELAVTPLLASTAASVATVSRGKLVTVIKSGGGVGATAMLTQLAMIHSRRQSDQAKGSCLVDLDVQFGDAAFQLDLRPSLSLTNLLEAGSRVDGAMLQAAAVTHGSGLDVIGSPGEILPLDSFDCEQVLDLIDLALEQFATVFVDLPSNWTDWSMSLVARSDLVLLFTELSVPALRQARRQLDLIASQDLHDLDVRVVLNRHEAGFMKKIRPADAEQALGRPVSYTLTNEPDLVRAAIDQGLAISEVRRRSSLAKDLERVADGVAALVRQER